MQSLAFAVTLAGMTTALAPITRHSVECGICGAVETCASDTLIRGVAHDSFTGSELVALTATLALPAGWILRDFITEITFVCGSCSLSDRPHSG